MWVVAAQPPLVKGNYSADPQAIRPECWEFAERPVLGIPDDGLELLMEKLPDALDPI